MKISETFPAKFLRLDDIQEGQRIVGIIQDVRMELLNDREKPVLLFDNGTGQLTLNATNARTISAALGDETDNWTGHSIEIYRGTIDFPKPNTACLKVRVLDTGKPAPTKSSVRPINGNGTHTPTQSVRGEMDDEIPFN